MHNRTRGFTLIELLVVIAIIGILSSVVLASLNTARGKGSDAKVKSQLAGLRASAEIYYDNNGSYGAASDDCALEMFIDATSGIAQYTDPLNYPTGATLSCHSDGVAYAVSGLLPTSTTGAAWCVDSSGSSREVAATLGVGEVVCP